jgi:hypothetical protein
VPAGLPGEMTRCEKKNGNNGKAYQAEVFSESNVEV